MKTNEKLTELKNLIMMSYDDVNDMITDFEDTEAHAYLLSALDLVAELAVANKVKLKIWYIIKIATLELRFLIECAYNDIKDMIIDFEDTEVHAYLLSALDLVDDLADEVE